ncbi:6129_t:CDS:2 [Funneliformis geosporum]|uniref:6129_t:CDS:1 n=1 Tax=Funneliformis geosporum TaxID=1117311 RepID=A0A9W4SVU3_9GLOM|nr:6129_t:CDS:2 [Funneliformis geosporum]
MSIVISGFSVIVITSANKVEVIFKCRNIRIDISSTGLFYLCLSNGNLSNSSKEHRGYNQRC